MQISQKHSYMSPEDQSLKTLSADFLALLDKGQAFSDVTFKVEDRHVFAHRCVLAARSPFFRMVFCDDQQLNSAQPRPGIPNVISVGVVGYDVFMLLLQFLYSGNYSNFFSPQNCGRQCKDKSCWHTHCSSAVEFGLDTMKAALFFGLDQLSTLTQKHLAAMAEKASVEDVMRILTTAHTQENKHLWNVCSKLVAKSGPFSEILQKHLPANIVCELEDIRRKSGFGFEAAMSSNTTSEQKTKRMQKALDSSDVELVQLMINGEGLNLDKAFALHYAVSKCSRKVVKTLLDLGKANVNLRGPDGLTPLHIAAKLGDPEKIVMLLNHEADPHVQSASGATAMGIVQFGMTEIVSAGGYNSKGDQNRLRLCMELLERAILAPTSSLHARYNKVESGSPASILTGHGSSTFLPEESDTDFRWSMRRTMSGSNQGVYVGNNDISSSFSHGLTDKVPQPGWTFRNTYAHRCLCS
ncbi:regulatory protein NPR6 isoform X2 [Physcomitrium patens]|uniref:BTB domain-containing protein n=1 Tax=Physcomitrium patens TaxID=3218 RepID=A0A7I4BKN6_PHYPA|nr:regulatory protein NPR6-like isoform X2 [Physcomitrium patens]XP_024400787.1 regulatory protein NPR6-like isoform X2 [Physcomitrium patens]|eukprot:XP_024400786.1 regulatory protein NPR6-like isoform X2 [Physcomitrella patens]